MADTRYSMQLVDVLSGIFVLYFHLEFVLLPTFVQDVPNLSFLDPKGKGRCSTCVATVPYVQCGSRTKTHCFCADHDV